jgi:hypothetical protein
MNAWIEIPFTVQEEAIEDKDIKTKAYIRGEQEDNTLKADFQDSNLATLSRKSWFRTPDYLNFITKRWFGTSDDLQQSLAVRPVFSECQHQYDGKRQTGSSS